MAAVYEKMSLAQLKVLAKEMGLKRTTQLRKKELIQVLIKHSEESSDNDTEKEPVQETLPLEGAQEQEASDIVKPRRGRPRKKPQEEPAVLTAKTGQDGAVLSEAGQTTNGEAGTEDGQLTLPEEMQEGTESDQESDAAVFAGTKEDKEEYEPKAGEPQPVSAQAEEPQEAEAEPAEATEASEQSEDSGQTEAFEPAEGPAHPGEAVQPESSGTAHPNADSHSERHSGYHPYHRESSEEKTFRQDGKGEYGRTEYQQREYRQGYRQEYYKRPDNRFAEKNPVPTDMAELDSGETKEGILEVMSDGYGFIRCDNYLPGENDVYVSPAQIRRFNLKTGDIIVGNTRIRNQNEKFSALLYVKSVNGFHPSEAQKRKRFEDLTPIFPNERIFMETPDCSIAMRMIDIFSPIGKGQRGMIVSQPKAGKTTILKQIAASVTKNYPDMNLIILLIDERPEEVTDIRESIEGKNVEVIYSTFDELPENHKRVSEMVIERAKRLVEHKKDVVILLDSITRLARAYNLTVQPSGRTLSGGLDPAALHMPKRFFGAARNMREGGSLTVLATALVDTGSRMDDVVFEEFKGTGNMEIVLDRSLSERRIFPAIDLMKSSTRRDDLLLEPVYFESANVMRKWLSGQRSEDALEHIINIFQKTKTNTEFIKMLVKTKI